MISPIRTSPIGGPGIAAAKRFAAYLILLLASELFLREGKVISEEGKVKMKAFASLVNEAAATPP